MRTRSKGIKSNNTTQTEIKVKINKKVKEFKTKTQEEPKDSEKNSGLHSDIEQSKSELEGNIVEAKIVEEKNEINDLHYGHNNMVLINKDIKFEQKYKYLGAP